MDPRTASLLLTPIAACLDLRGERRFTLSVVRDHAGFDVARARRDGAH